METIKKLMFGASGLNFKLFKGIINESRLELRLVVIFCVFTGLLASLNPSFMTMTDLAIISAFKSYKPIPQELNSNEKIDVQQIVSKTMSYSYESTELGFYLKDLKFFDVHTKAQAEKRILTSLPTSLRENARKYVRAVLLLSQNHQVDPIWVLSVMWTESHFDYSAKSWAGARGLMQIMPETRKFVYQQYKLRGRKLMVEDSNFNVNRFFPYPVDNNNKTAHIRKLVNIELGIIYLKSLLNTFKSHKHATVAYNMGPGWTLMRLRKNLPVGEKNEYLDKVENAYKRIVKKI
ncbi:MAG: transglycosylase SLT domain-containing protein [Bdellovibrionota bacterium]|nr:transglycosylase SLT domain-containing protein [Bdellovibrionota bacterium]